MTDGGATCSQCGAALAPASRFCGECGAEPSAEPAAPPSFSVPKTTMLGVVAGPLVPPPSPLPPSFADDAGRTTEVGVSEPPRGKVGRTMLGIPTGPTHAGAARQNTLSPGKLEAKLPPKGTMLGLPPGMAVPGAPAPSAPAAPPAAPVPAQPSPQNTMFGVAGGMPAGSDVAPRPVSDAAPRPASPTDISLPMPAYRPADKTPLPPSVDDDAASSAPTYRLEDREPTLRTGARKVADLPGARSSRGPFVALALVVALGAVAAAWFLTRHRGPDVAVRIAQEAGVEQLVFEVAGAAPGAKLRFGGQEQALEGGRATFRLGADSLQVGKNAVVFDVLEPDGDSHPGRVTLSLDYRVTVDVAPLHAGKGALDVVVAALPGSRVWLGGEELPIDAQGHAQRRETIEPGVLESGEAVEHVVSYRVQPPQQEAQVGEIRTRVPITALAIDRPGRHLVTDATSIELAGTTDADAVVMLGAEPIVVRAGRFLHGVALPSVGKHSFVLEAHAPSKAPRRITVEVERVADLAAAARDFPVDAEMTYARIASNPATYAGKKAAYEGRVYNVAVDKGHSVLQMLVRDCPSGQRCPLWISYGAATDVTVGAWVRAVGTLAGAQQFRAENDALQTVPKLDAELLAPSEP